MRPNCKLLLTPACLLLTWAAPANAGMAQASFAVDINLSNSGSSAPPCYCISQKLSQSTNAIVKVVCSTNQFVSIEPQPGKHGAYRFVLEPSKMMSSDDPLWHIGVGTITTMHVIHDKGQEDVLKMLVNF